MKQYFGKLLNYRKIVVVEDLDILETYDLELRLDLAPHSPSGFAWGYGGSGSAQLALALLADCCGDKTALKYYQRFKWDVVAKLEQDKVFVMNEQDILKWVENAEVSDL